MELYLTFSTNFWDTERGYENSFLNLFLRVEIEHRTVAFTFQTLSNLSYIDSLQKKFNKCKTFIANTEGASNLGSLTFVTHFIITSFLDRAISQHFNYDLLGDVACMYKQLTTWHQPADVFTFKIFPFHWPINSINLKCNNRSNVCQNFHLYFRNTDSPVYYDKHRKPYFKTLCFSLLNQYTRIIKSKYINIDIYNPICLTVNATILGSISSRVNKLF